MTESEALDCLRDLGIPDNTVLYLMDHGHMAIEDIAECARKAYDEGMPVSEIIQGFNDLMRRIAEDEEARRMPQFCAVPASSFTERPTSFLWKPYLPEGEFTVMMAPGGSGKTFFVCALAAAISRGAALPGEERGREAAKVLIISAEDEGSVLRARLESCGADLERVLLIDSRASQGMSLSASFEDFRETVLAYRPRLVVVDPWHAFLGASVDMNRANIVRPVFQKLANLSKECGCATLLLAHVNKRLQTENINNAAMGSADLVNAARSVLYLLRDPEDRDCRVAVHSKANYAEEGQSLKLRIRGGGAAFVGFSDVTREEVETANRRHKSLGELRSLQKQQRPEGLIEILAERANPFAPVRLSYEELLREHGSLVFGGRQPKRALDACREALEARGYYLRTGLKVVYQGRRVGGFSLQPLQAEPEQSVLPD